MAADKLKDAIDTDEAIKLLDKKPHHKIHVKPIPKPTEKIPVPQTEFEIEEYDFYVPSPLPPKDAFGLVGVSV